MAELQRTDFMNIDKDNHFRLELAVFVGLSVAVLGMTGQGKTNTDAVITEEALSHGYPLTIIDPEGEFFSLKERFEILVAGRSPNVDITLTSLAQTRSLAELSMQRGVPVVLDLSGFKTNAQEQEEMFGLVEAYLENLWDLAIEVRRPYLLVVEEAQEFVPQGGSSPAKELLIRFAKRGRKRGVGIVLASQRPASVDKNVLTQTSMLVLHKVINPNTDLKAYKELIPLPGREVEKLVSGLQVGQAIILYNNEHWVVQMRRCYTTDVGATPGFDTTRLEKVQINAKLLAEFTKLVQKAASDAPDGQTLSKRQAQLENRIKELEAQLSQAQAINDELRRENEKLSRLSVHLDGNLLNEAVLTTPLVKQPIPAPLEIKLPHHLQIEKAEVQELKVAATVTAVTSNINPPDKSDRATQTTNNSSPSVTAAQLTKNLTHFSAKKAQSSVAVPSATTQQPQVSVKSVTQRQAFDQLLERLTTLSKLERAVFRLLLNYPHNEFGADDMAAWLKKSEAYVKNCTPNTLLNLKLVARHKDQNNRYVYQSNVTAFLGRHYPDLDSDALITDLTEALAKTKS